MKEDVRNLTFHRGLPDVEDTEGLSGGHALLVLDGFVQVVNSKTVQDMFCHYCHHTGINVGLYKPECISIRNVCLHHCIKHPCVTVDEEHEKLHSKLATLPGSYTPMEKGILREIYEDCMKTPMAI